MRRDCPRNPTRHSDSISTSSYKHIRAELVAHAPPTPHCGPLPPGQTRAVRCPTGCLLTCQPDPINHPERSVNNWSDPTRFPSHRTPDLNLPRPPPRGPCQAHFQFPTIDHTVPTGLALGSGLLNFSCGVHPARCSPVLPINRPIASHVPLRTFKKKIKRRTIRNCVCAPPQVRADCLTCTRCLIA